MENSVLLAYDFENSFTFHQKPIECELKFRARVSKKQTIYARFPLSIFDG